MLHWYLVHNRTKRLPPVAAVFKEFLLREGAPLIERLVGFGPTGPSGGPRAAAARAARGKRRTRRGGI